MSQWPHVTVAEWDNAQIGFPRRHARRASADTRMDCVPVEVATGHPEQSADSVLRRSRAPIDPRRHALRGSATTDP